MHQDSQYFGILSIKAFMALIWKLSTLSVANPRDIYAGTNILVEAV
jgi:hypothetical protein